MLVGISRSLVFPRSHSSSQLRHANSLLSLVRPPPFPHVQFLGTPTPTKPRDLSFRRLSSKHPTGRGWEKETGEKGGKKGSLWERSGEEEEEKSPETFPDTTRVSRGGDLR